MTVIATRNHFMEQLAQWMAFGNHTSLRTSSSSAGLEKGLALLLLLPPG
jgi:hypothetical protein